MKTKDFIKMLQEEDPEGEGYIRFPEGGAPWFAERKPGYYDGSYQYILKESGHTKIVTTRQGYKIDLYVYRYDDLIWEYDGNMEEIRKRIILDERNFYSDKEKESFWKYIEEEAELAREHDKKFLESWYKQVVEKFYDNGWEIRQPLDKPIGQYHCMKAHKWFHVPDQLNQGECEILVRSGKFYPEKKKKYYVWHHDPEKGKDWSIK